MDLTPEPDIDRGERRLSAIHRERFHHQLTELATLAAELAHADGVTISFSYSDKERVVIRHGEEKAATLSVPIHSFEKEIGTLAFNGAGLTESPHLTTIATQISLLLENRALAEEATRSNVSKDEFLATVSHELRSPMTSILGWVRMLKIGDLDAQTLETAIDSIERSAKVQAQLVEDLLDISRIDTGKLRLESRHVDLRAMAEASLEGVRPQADEKEICLSFESDCESCVVSGDPNRIHQIISNLLTNAVKFSPVNSSVELRIMLKGESAIITVRDYGIGIQADFLPLIFERFRQEESTVMHSRGGLGLGLAIVRHLSELHGGSVSAASEGEGLGTMFTVTLPAMTGTQEQQQALAYVGRAEEARIDTLPSLSNASILVIDNEYDTVEMISAILERCGAKVTATTSAREAIELIDRVKPDAIVCDIFMPEIDGMELLRQLRARPASKGGTVPAIALTVLSRPDDRERIAAAGFTAYRQKPVEPADLAHTIARVLEKSDPESA